MSSLTLTIDEDLLRDARIRALQLGTSVNALVREWLENFANADSARHVTDSLVALAERSRASSGPGGRTWSRDDLYEERLGGYAG